VGEVVLGIATSTLDASGEVTGRWDMSAVGLDDVRTVAAGFVGAIRQVPPMVSAVHVAGRRLHELARAGIEVERKGREVHVHRLAVEPLYEAGGAGDGFAGAGEGRGYGSSGCPAFRMEVECSSGTYVRTLAADIGAALGGGAHLRRLRRTAVGSFTTADAVALEALGPEAVLSPAEALRDYPAVTVGDAAITDASHGRPLDVSVLGALTEPPWVVHDGSGALVAVYEAGTDGRARAAVVLAPAG
jgi:tRNA pseudouridine55 synthase